MDIKAIDNLTFNAKVDKKFIKNTERYCFKRNLPLQYDLFRKSLNKVEYIGSDNSEIVYTTKREGESLTHLLCLKNTKLNNKTAIIIAVSKKYSDIMKYFSNITDDMMQTWEDYLTTI